MDQPTLENWVRRVREDGYLRLPLKRRLDAIELVRYAEKAHGYHFSIGYTRLGCLVMDGDK